MRRAMDLTQEEIARRAGVSLNWVNALERGRISDPHISTLLDLADALGVGVEELVRKEADPVPLGEAAVA
jgi:transcriptional regulator with XRE-family HTH domain